MLGTLKDMNSGIRLCWQLPGPNSIFILGGHDGHSVNKALSGLPTFDFDPQEVKIWLRWRFIKSLFRWTRKYGFSSARLISALGASRAHAIVCLEQVDRQNTLRDVSFALPNLRILLIQQSRIYEAPHFFSSWGNQRNVRFLLWGREISEAVALLGAGVSGHVPTGSLTLSNFVRCAPVPRVPRTIPLLVCVKPKAVIQKSLMTERERQSARERGGVSKSRLLEMLGRYAQERSMTLWFPEDKRFSTSEESHFVSTLRVLTGADCRVARVEDLALDPERHSPTSTLWTLLASRVVVGVNTSLLWDAVALRVPVVYASFGASKYDCYPKIGSWVLNNPSFEEFSQSLSEAGDCDSDELNKRASLLDSWLRDPTKVDASSILRKVVSKSLEAASLDDVFEVYDQADPEARLNQISNLIG